MMDSTLFPFHAASFLSFLLDVSLKSFPLFALVGLVCLGLRPASAASRHALWLVTVVSLLCLPALCVLLPRWSVPVLPASAQHPAQPPTPAGRRVEEVVSQQPLAMEQPPAAAIGKLLRRSAPATGSVVSTSSPIPSLSAPNAIPLPATSPVVPASTNSMPIIYAKHHATITPTLTQLVLLIWLSGVLMVLARAFIGIIAAGRLMRSCQAVVSGPLVDAAEQAQNTLGLSYGVQLREGPPGMVMVPMTFGLLRPVVLLPSGAAHWPVERLRVVMLHEIAHVKRHDWLTTMLAEVACALYWFHPLAWLSSHRLRAESEQACDDLVLASGVQAMDYANHLLEVVRGLTLRRGSMPAVVTMAQDQNLTGRLKTILAESKNRSAATGRGLSLALLAALVMVMPLAAMRPVSKRSTVGVGLATSPWTVTLPDGTQAGLISVAARNSATGRGPTWTPEGRPLDSIPPIASAESDQTNLKMGGRTFTAGFFFPSRQISHEAQVTLHVLGDQFFPVGGMERMGDRDARLDASHDFPPGQGRADIVLTIAEGPYTTLATGTFQGGGSRWLPTGELVTVSRAMPSSATVGGRDVKIRQVMLTVPSRFVSDPNQYDLDLLGLDGQPLRISHTSSNIPNPKHKIEHIFFNYRASELPEGGVSGFRFRYRLVHTFIFRGVALKPIAQTTSTTSSSSSGPAATSETAPLTSGRPSDVALLPDGTQVRLMAVVPKASGRRPMWSPIGSPVSWTGPLKNQGFIESQIADTGSQIAAQRNVQFWLLTTPRGRYTSGSVRLVRRSPGRADVTIPVTTGSYATLIGGSTQTGAVRRLSTGEVVRLSKAVEHPPANNPVGRRLGPVAQVTLNVPTRYARDYSSYWLMGVGPDGKLLNGPYLSITDVAKPGQRERSVIFSFRSAQLKRMGVKGFRFMYRPVHDLTFRDVALRPDGPDAHQPALQASGTPAASPMASSHAPVVVNGVGGRAQVARGVSLQLVGVSDQPSNNSRWWRPDGTPFVYQSKVLRVNFNAVPNGTPASHWSIFMFRLTQPKNDVTLDPWWHPEVQPEGRTPKAGFYAVDRIHGITFSGFVQKVAEGPNSLVVRLRVATGLWQTEQAHIKPTQAALTIGRAVSVGQPQERWTGSYKLHWLSPTSTRVTLTRSTKDVAEEMRVVAVDGQGRWFLPGPSVSNFAGGHIETWYPLSLPLAKIKELVMETRPYTAVDFKGVARQPIASAFPVAAPSLPAKAQADQDISASNLHQIGLGIFHYAAAHNQHFPDAAHWMDQIIPYLVPSQITGAARRQRIASLFHDPAAPAGQTWSYAYNRTLSGLTNSQVDTPNQIVAVFETSRGVRNASDGGQSLPQPGRHSGGNIFLFADGHTKWLRPEQTPLLFAKLHPPVIDSSGNLTHPEYTTDWFAPVNPASRQKIPIHGQVYNRRTMKPLSSTFVIFSQSLNKITVGSVWPSSFTNKAGRFQSILYPGKNYLMVLEDNRFRFAGKTLKYESSGNKGSISTQGTKIGPSRSARSDYLVHWTLSQGYSLKASSSQGGTEGASITAFMPIARSASR